MKYYMKVKFSEQIVVRKIILKESSVRPYTILGTVRLVLELYELLDLKGFND